MTWLLRPAIDHNLFNDSQYSDVEIHFSSSWDRTKETSIYHCHKAILSMKSTFFRQKLDSEPNAKVLQVKDDRDCKDHFEAFLKVLYGYTIQPIENPSREDIKGIIDIHRQATTKYGSPDVQAAACATLQTILRHQKEDPCLTVNYTEMDLHDDFESYVVCYYRDCGPYETDMGRILCEFLVKEYTTLLTEATLQHMIRESASFARDALFAILKHGGIPHLTGDEH
ncbi:hypothetical protein K491DRAFT_737870 [Lophiostoma macrostomum CBS 122681]|uniref:BTB domain-containing protein n=1 Tax=Lophiostoma macrostomum CBS 122681 TaxID=1314788 RepID=A0A6A6TFB4_9PLEO|nr:hypothetical protein K491DRAFT_737870 [Lophiostoma macrostomum CBS 122681]